MRRSLTLALVTAILVPVALEETAALGGTAAWAGPPSAVPAGFHAQSLSWTSAQAGWMLGLAPCGQATCTTVVGTTDGGGTWNTLGTLDAPLTFEKPTGVTEVRFADDLHGWAFDPALYATTDGGATWARQAPPGGGHLVWAVAADADAAYAVVSPCRLNQVCHHPATLWRTTPDQGSWTRVSLTLPALSASTILAVHGLVGYLIAPAPLVGSAEADVLDVTVDGLTWSARPDPCKPAAGETLNGVAPISDTKVALLCQANIGFGQAAKRVLRSNDTGRTARKAGALPLLGITSQLAATPDGTLVASSYSIGSWIYRNAGGQSWTAQVDLGDGGIGWNDIGFTTTQIGFVIHGPAASPCCGNVGELWETVDGGVTWAPV